MKYVIGLGSNVGPSRETIEQAVTLLSKHSLFHLLRMSSLYKTAPWGKTDQPPFVNAVVLADWRGSGDALLELLLAMEKRFGRTREVHWGPRTLDLDILWREGPDIQDEHLSIPHPYFRDRAFVLVPLAEIWPDFSLEGVSIGELIQRLPDAQEVEKII